MSFNTISIGDGRGDGNEARVDNNYRLHVLSVTEPVIRAENFENLAWSYTFEVTPASAGAYFFYMKNTAPVHKFAITDVRFRATSATEVDIDHVAGKPIYTNGVYSTPTSLLIGGSNTPNVIAKHATDISGLTKQGSSLYFEPMETADKLYHLKTSAGILLPRSTAIAFKNLGSNANTAIKITVSIYEVTLEE